jgi:LysR family transcriptional regulator, cyn operon transcriptional activator
MELNHLKYFYEVAKSGSFTEAARRLHISQSALSKAVRQLEDSEGVKLFTRGKEGVTPTRIGAEIFEKSRAIFEVVTDIEETCRGTKSVCEGYLRFGASDHIVNYLLLKPLASMVKAHPKVIPSIVTGGPNEICASILNNESEFGLFFTKVNIPHLLYESVMNFEMAVVHRPQIAAPEGKPSLASLRAFIKKHGYISSVGSQYQMHPSRSLLGRLKDFPPVIFEANSQEAQKRFCREFGGVAYVTRFMVAAELNKRTLVEFALPEKFHLDLLLARRKGRTLSLNAQTFLEELKLSSV